MSDIQAQSIPAQRCTLAYTDEWSSNGNRSLKIYSNTNNTFYFGPNSEYLGITNQCIGKTIQFTADINTNVPLYLRIFIYVNGSWNAHSVLVDSLIKDACVSAEVPLDCSNIWFRIDSTRGYEDVTVYTDNWRLIILD